MYTLKSGYLDANNIFTKEEEMIYSEPSITKFQDFASKIKALSKICHLIWKIISRHLAVTMF